MLLLLQLHGDLPEHFPNDERRLYIFGCTRKPCARKSGSIRALRGVKRHKPQKSQAKKKENEPSPKEEQKKAQSPPNLGSSIFGSTSSGPSSNANPFSTSSTSSSMAANPFAPLPAPSTLAAKPPQKPSSTTPEDLPETFASKARVSSPPPPPSNPLPAEPWPSESDFPAPYPHYHLDAEYETLSRPSTPATTATPKIDTEDSSSAAGGADTKDAFESSLDKSFLRFSARLEHNPEQVLRYEFRGTPILYSTTDAVGKLFSQNAAGSGHVKVSTSANSSSVNRIPRCESCGRERVFELQLVPHAISVLEEGRSIGLGEKDDAGMEWGTVILGVCNGDCGEEGVVSWREEWVGVQWEERG
jgi:pre-rRNA-processing protein TSR4